MNQLSTQPTTPLRCFRLPKIEFKQHDHWLACWQKQFEFSHISLGSKVEQALARLVPTLICGEQSAVFIFNEEKRRLDNTLRKQSGQLFASIECDEAMHEAALQMLSSQLPQPDDLHAIKRRAQHFYSRINREKTVSEHFAAISELDASVCLIMHAMSTSQLGKYHPISLLFEQIKKDEARHVAISRNHAQKLGCGREDFLKQRRQLRPQLISLLSPMQDAFESLGVDPDRLFERLQPRDC